MAIHGFLGLGSLDITILFMGGLWRLTYVGRKGATLAELDHNHGRFEAHCTDFGVRWASASFAFSQGVACIYPARSR
jgi:hypothetical protein